MQWRERHRKRIRLVRRVRQLPLALQLDSPPAVKAVRPAAHLPDQIVVIPPCPASRPCRSRASPTTPPRSGWLNLSSRYAAFSAPSELLDARRRPGPTSRSLSVNPCPHPHASSITSAADPLLVAVRLQNARHLHRVVPAHPPRDPRHAALSPHHHRMIMTPIAPHRTPL